MRRVEKLFAFADQIEARLTQAQTHVDRLTQSLLRKAFRGELVPTEHALARCEGRDYEPATDILSRIRVLLGQNQREHFCLMKTLSPPTSRRKADKDAFEYESAKLRHRIADLKRYSIQAVMLDGELVALRDDSRRRNGCVTIRNSQRCRSSFPSTKFALPTEPALFTPISDLHPRLMLKSS